ncbi:class I SAM-dependent methyltransferase [Streptomyces sp. NPDC013161]|uniref:class I SAM-dependent methyltransferase n=1 Tax=Streptomyces sp. NPDC013161 TaxID=3364862 RepID=UPI0036CDE796
MPEHRDYDYNEEARNYDATRGGDARATAAANAVHELLSAGSPILDIGGGTGIVANFLLKLGHEVTVVDSSAEMIRMCEARGTVPAVHADATSLPFPSSSIDNVIMIWLLHIVEDPAPFIAEMARVLKPGGRFVTTVDKLQSSKPGHTRARTDAPELISRLCQEAGLAEQAPSSFVGHGQKDEPLYQLAVFDRI